jgi:pimeloyl-ACP methyl ester carboxylesterase
VLLLRGEHSAVFPRLVADAMRTRNPDARIVEIENCGHAPSLMVEGQAALVADFLAAPVARPASQLHWRHERQDSPAAVAGAAH